MRKDKAINILSIDFDYFVNASIEERMTIFPDANDNLAIGMNTFLWANRYGTPVMMNQKELLDVECLEGELNQLIKYLRGVAGQVPRVVVVNSHVELYKEVNDMVRLYEGACKKVNMIHIDHHSDCYKVSDRRELNCGNWINHLVNSVSNRKELSIKWIHNKDSELESIEDFSGIVEDFSDGTNMYEDLSSTFSNHTPDLIFLCKSVPWTPPHLDHYFDDLVRVVEECYGEPDWTIPVKYRPHVGLNFDPIQNIANRYTPKFKEYVKESLKQYEEIYSKHEVK